MAMLWLMVSGYDYIQAARTPPVQKGHIPEQQCTQRIGNTGSDGRLNECGLLYASLALLTCYGRHSLE